MGPGHRTGVDVSEGRASHGSHALRQAREAREGDGMSEHMETTEPGDGAMVIALVVLVLVFFAGLSIGWLL